MGLVVPTIRALTRLGCPVLGRQGEVPPLGVRDEGPNFRERNLVLLHRRVETLWTPLSSGWKKALLCVHGNIIWN